MEYPGEGFIHQEHENKPVCRPVYGDRLRGDALHQRQNAYEEALDDGYVNSHLSEWNERTEHRLRERRPHVVVPSGLPSNATAIDAYHSLFFSSEALTRGEKRGAIVAAGVPVWTLLNVDDPDTVADDALRVYYQHLAHDILDPEQQKLETKVNGLLREKGPEKAFALGTSAVPIVTRTPLPPVVAIPIMAVRTLLSAREVVHDHVIDRLSDHLEKLNDPEVYAQVKWLTKPLTERARDHELQDAVLALKMPEIASVLEKSEITGEIVPLLDESHTSAKYLWDEEDKQEQVFRQNVRKMIDLRKKVAGVNKRVRSQEWEEFGEEITKYFGGVKIFGVNTTDGPETVDSIKKRHPLLQVFVSQRIHGIVLEVIQEEITGKRLADKPVEEDRYPGSDINDF